MTTRFGAVGVFGRANAGKSTLVNALVGEVVSIVSNRPQTTRKRILGILTVNETQLVFCDTPGLHSIKNKLDAYMNDEIMSTMKGLQAGMYLVDLSDLKLDLDREYISQLDPASDMPLFLVLNKSDLVDAAKIEEAKSAYESLYPFKKVFVISAAKKKGLKQLLNSLCRAVPKGPHAYDADDYTSLTEREIVEETIREGILRMYNQEVPHSVAVQVEQFSERENGKTYIEATLNVEREAHKKIIIGKDGEGIKKNGRIAREKLNTMLGRDIFLQLWVKVRPDWRHNDIWIQRLGYKK